MNKVSIIFTRSRNPLAVTSRVISWRIGKPYSHVAIVFHSPWLEIDLVIQASHGMVHCIPMERFQREDMVVRKYDIDLQPEEIARGIQWAVRQCGAGYSEMGAIAATFRLLRKMGFGEDGDHEFICSEFTARFMEESKGIQLDYMRAVDHIDPAMLEELIAYLSQEAA